MAIRSTYWDQTNEAERDTVIPPSDSLPAFRLYLDWGRYDSRSPAEGNDIDLATSRFAAALSDKGWSRMGQLEKPDPSCVWRPLSGYS